MASLPTSSLATSSSSSLSSSAPASAQDAVAFLLDTYQNITTAVTSRLPPNLQRRYAEYHQWKLATRTKKQKTDFSNNLLMYQEHYGGLAPADTVNLFRQQPMQYYAATCLMPPSTSASQSPVVFFHTLAEAAEYKAQVENIQLQGNVFLPLVLVERWLPNLVNAEHDYSSIAVAWFGLLGGRDPGSNVYDMLRVLSDNVELIVHTMNMAQATANAWASMFSILSTLPNARKYTHKRIDYYSMLAYQLALLTSGNPAVESIAELRRNYCQIALGGSRDWTFVSRDPEMAATVLRRFDAPMLNERAAAFCEPWSQLLDSRVAICGTTPFWIASFVPSGCLLTANEFSHEQWRDAFLSALPNVDINVVMRPEAMLGEFSPAGAAKRFAQYLVEGYMLRFPSSSVRVLHGRDSIVVVPEYGRKIVVSRFLTQSEGGEFASLARSDFGCGVMHIETVTEHAAEQRRQKLREKRWHPSDVGLLAPVLDSQAVSVYDDAADVGSYATAGLLAAEEKKNASEEEKRARSQAAAAAIAVELAVTATAVSSQDFHLTPSEIEKLETKKRVRSEQKRRDVEAAQQALSGLSLDQKQFTIHLSALLMARVEQFAGVSLERMMQMQQPRLVIDRVRFAPLSEADHVRSEHWKATISKDNKTGSDALRRMDYRTFTEFLYCLQDDLQYEDWRM